jgi:3-oxoacyl-[acyl-carrier-protein] synthase-3
VAPDLYERMLAGGVAGRIYGTGDQRPAGAGTAERKMFSKIYGLKQSPTLAPDEQMQDLLLEAGRAALDGGTAAVVLYGHTLLTQEFGLRGGFADQLRAGLGVPDAGFFGFSHINCTSVLRCVEYARRYLMSPEAGPDDRVLVLGGDQGSISDTSRYVPGMTVGGDAAVGVLVQRSTSPSTATGSAGSGLRYRYLSGAVGRDARFHRNLGMDAAETALYGQVCAEQSVQTMQRAAHVAGLDTDQIDWVMPHLSNRMFWRTFSSRSGIARERICLDLLPEQGHTFGADSLMALEHADRTGRLRPGDRCALISIGQGAYFQTVIVEVEEDR